MKKLLEYLSENGVIVEDYEEVVKREGLSDYTSYKLGPLEEYTYEEVLGILKEVNSSLTILSILSFIKISDKVLELEGEGTETFNQISSIEIPTLEIKQGLVRCKHYLYARIKK